MDGEPGQRRRAARAGRAVVRRELRVGPEAAHALSGAAQRLGRDLREDRALALAHLGRADEHDGLPVRLEAHDRAARPDARRRRAARPRRRGPRPAASGSSQPSAAAAFSTSPTRSASSGLPPRRTGLAAVGAGCAAASRAASRPARRATSSTWSSPAHWRCEAPNARYEPDGAVFVWTQSARTRTADQRYGPGAASPPVATTRGPLSA